MSQSDHDAVNMPSEASRERPASGSSLDTVGDILIVDDCPTSLVMASEILHRGGHTTRTASDGRQAQKAIREHPPSLLLVDLNMPQMGGLELCGWTKSQPAGADIPVLFLSSTTETDRKREAFEKGAADFITKPFQPEELLLRVALHLQLFQQQKALRRSYAEREAEVQRQLQRSNSELLKLHAAVEQSPSAVLVTDRQANIEYVNRKFTEISGYTFEEMRGRTPALLRGPDTHPKIYEELWSTISRGETWRGLFQNKRKNGELFWDRTVIAPVRAQGDDVITHFIALKEDITSQREVEAQLQQAQKMEAIGQLAAGIAHEINTPTQFVSDNVYFLKGAFDDLLALLEAYQRALAAVPESSMPAGWASELRTMERQTDLDYVKANGPGAFESSLDGIKRISTIVHAMKEFSHPDQREMEPADLNAAIVTTLTIARNEYKYVAEVEKDLGTLPLVTCHVGDICQVILNILVNAAHAIGDVTRTTGKRGLIRVRSTADESHVRIEIEDNGTGIPESARPHVFEPFFTTKEAGRGTGQGLAIAQSIVVKKHKGTVSFETAVGKGTTFVIRLPIAGATTEQIEQRGEQGAG